MLRAAGAAASVGVRALLVHAIDESAERFYRRFGFAPSPLSERTLFLRIDDILASAKQLERGSDE